MRKVLVMDTSILCVWLKVPNMKTCGPKHDVWDHDRVQKKIDQERADHSTLVLPLATIIETGNHISQASEYRKERADSLSDLMVLTADNKSPWAAFSDQSVLWSPDKIKSLAAKWPKLAAAKHSIGDATIVDVAEHYAQMGYKVEILTGDQGLKSHEPFIPLDEPRRRKNQ